MHRKTSLTSKRWPAADVVRFFPVICENVEGGKKKKEENYWLSESNICAAKASDRAAFVAF